MTRRQSTCLPHSYQMTDEGRGGHAHLPKGHRPGGSREIFGINSFLHPKAIIRLGQNSKGCVK